MNIKLSSLALAATLFAGHAGAALVSTYSTESSFLGALVGGNAAVEDLESFENGDSAGGGSLGLNFGSSGNVAQLTGPDSIGSTEGGADTQGRSSIGVGTSKFWEGGASPFTITFASAIRAFGFWMSDVGDFSVDCVTCTGVTGSVLTVEFLASGQVIRAEGISGSTIDGATSFFGLVSDTAFDAIRFTNNTTTTANQSGVADGQGFDIFMFGTPTDTPTGNVPEPGMLALSGLGLLALAGRRRRGR